MPVATRDNRVRTLVQQRCGVDHDAQHRAHEVAASCQSRCDPVDLGAQSHRQQPDQQQAGRRERDVGAADVGHAQTTSCAELVVGHDASLRAVFSVGGAA